MAVLEIGPNCVGIIHYTLRDEGGVVLDSSSGGAPIPYLHGAQNIVVGLENSLVGKTAGDRLEVEVPPSEGYGERMDHEPQAVHRRELPRRKRWERGMSFVAEGSEGQSLRLWVTDVRGSRVWVDVNHPFAGKTLFFDVTVVKVRPATREEIAHQHPHGLDGTAHHH